MQIGQPITIKIKLMCLTVYFNSKQERDKGLEPKIAKKNIKVYKVVLKGKDGIGYQARYRPGFYYNRGDTYNAKMRPAIGITYIYVEEGLHSCKTKRLASYHMYEHSVIGYGRLTDAVVVTMIIPKGAKYYENDREYASGTLVFPKRRLLGIF